MKFSIIVPVYNVEKYLDKCLKSILNQTYDNYEVVIVNDGSPDDSQNIIDKYVKNDKRFIGYKKGNGGLSSARNYGLEKITGDYILFVDSDDYLENELLEKLNLSLTKNKVDLIRFECNVVDEKGNILFKPSSSSYTNTDVEKVINELVAKEYFEPVWSYCYSSSFFKKNKFKFEIGRIHEDYGIMLLILYYANNITALNYYGYNYVQRENSIMSDKNYEKIKKSTQDYIDLYINDYKILSKEKTNIKKKVLLTYGAECVIFASRMLKDTDFVNYTKKIKEEKIVNKIYPYNIKKIIKRLVASLNINLYNKLFGSVKNEKS